MSSTTRTTAPSSTSQPSATAMPDADMVLAPTATYAEAYAVLSKIAERLRATGASANIDRLAADLRTARAAHALCRDRLAAIRAEIDLEAAGSQGEAHGAA